MKKKISTLLLIIFLVFGFFTRFLNLDWSSPFYFHPDERNIVSAVGNLSYPFHMNPHFFAYGSLPIYTSYFVFLFLQKFSFSIPPFNQIILILRSFSALYSLGLTLLLYGIGKKMVNKRTGLLSAFFATTSVGFIQFAHFGTFEMWLTFWETILFLLSLALLQKPTLRMLFFTTLVSGILLATKVSSLVFLPLPLIAYGIGMYKKYASISKAHVINQIIIATFLQVVISIIVFLSTNPFVLLDTQSFINSMNYESSVALGTLPVFYTGEFFQTTPVLFQLLHVFPFLMNPFFLLIGIISFFWVSVISIKKRRAAYFLLVVFFLFTLLSEAFFFVKWTRYMVPVLPFFYLMMAIFCHDIFSFLKRKSKKNFSLSFLYYLSFLVFLFVPVLFAIAYIKIAFIAKDTRFLAADWAKEHIPGSSSITGEIYDLGIVPFNSSFPNITLFNFYDMDNSPTHNISELAYDLSQSEYLILPSQRILKTRLINKNEFPYGHHFYQLFTTNQLGFQKIYETPCDIFCTITYVGSPVFSYEETANVFDRPTVFIYKKTANLSQQAYETILQTLSL